MSEDKQKKAVKAFCDECIWAWAVNDQYKRLFENGEIRHKLFQETASTFFTDILRIYKAYLFQQICKLTDPATTAGQANLTTNYLVENIHWPNDKKAKLESISEKLNDFRRLIIKARNKILSHNDLNTIINGTTLGAFPEGKEIDFWADLQEFVNIVYGHYFGSIYPIESITERGADDLVEALKKSVDYDDFFEEKQSEKFNRRMKMKYRDA
jgi:hypothetical protein